MKFSGIYLVICILWKEILAQRPTISLEKPATTDYFDGFINYLKKESKLYRVVFILEDQLENTDAMLNSLMKEVSQHFPSFSSNYNEISNWRDRINNETYNGRSNHRSSTLFVFQATNNDTMSSITNHLDEINFEAYFALPRCLIMNSFNSTHEYLNSTLHSFWKMNYLDVTIMTYNLKHQETPFLSHINPFTNTFTALEITSKIQWFPDKVNDLKGQALEFNYFSYSHDNNPDQVQWMEKRTTEIFARAMNSKLNISNSDAPQLYSVEESIGIEFINRIYLRIHKIGAVKAVVPRMEKITRNKSFSPQLLFMIIITICTIVIILLTASFLNFNRTTWQPVNIIQILIGMPAHQEPNKWIERIVFGSLLIVCTVYTGFIYSVILDISIQPVPEISTLQELIDSSLIPQIHWMVNTQLISSTTNPLVNKLSAKCQFFDVNYSFYGKRCLEYLTKYKNISCILPDPENKINKYLWSKGAELNVKILPEIVGYHFFEWSVVGNPPFTDFYNKVIQRATEFGLFDEVYSINNVLPGKTSLLEEIKHEKLFYIISYVLGFGFSISIIIFLFELIKKKFTVTVFNLYMRFRLGN